MCHGVFDFLHSGHIDHFYEAKKISEGSLLVVSLTDDKYVLKGSNRPIYKLSDRIKILSSLSVIDFIIVNQSITAIDLLKRLNLITIVKALIIKNLKMTLQEIYL